MLLENETIALIRHRYWLGETIASIARELSLGRMRVFRIVRGRSYRSAPGCTLSWGRSIPQDPWKRLTPDNLAGEVWGTSEPEEWRPVEDWPGYWVSSAGRVRGKSGRILKQVENSRGYLQVNLCRLGDRMLTLVHRMVAHAFLGPCPRGHECSHEDGGKKNNKASNLAWRTAASNQHQRFRHGTSAIDPKWVLEIRERRASGERRQSIARDFGVSSSQISSIATGRTFASLPGPRTRFGRRVLRTIPRPATFKNRVSNRIHPPRTGLSRALMV